jgi:CheY-like chemotaxis protein
MADTPGIHTILVVDDAEDIRKMICSILGINGYRCLEAADGLQALDVLGHHSGSVDLVITDIVMPRMDGNEFASRLAKLEPAARLIFMSGYAGDPVVRPVRMDSLFLPKPFTAAALLDTVRRSFDRPPNGQTLDS